MMGMKSNKRAQEVHISAVAYLHTSIRANARIGTNLTLVTVICVTEVKDTGSRGSTQAVFRHALKIKNIEAMSFWGCRI